MHKRHPHIFSEMQETLRYLVSHVENLETAADERETRLEVQEKIRHVEGAPTVSAGTKRLIDILTAYYALEMRSPEVPGLIVLEEPDMAVHPLLLRRLVEQLRIFTEQDGKPRQFIITTHNPALLNLFEPKEVRIVERNEAGETSVRQADEVLIEKWREQTGDYNLDDLWTTRLLGGVPQ
ncbi:MAG: AAA family ATPase [Anaerolineae bacterium]